MKHKQRKSESNTPQKLVEYLQNGILIRFNEIKIQKEEGVFYQCEEFWFEINEKNIENIITGEGFELTENHKKLIK